MDKRPTYLRERKLNVTLHEKLPEWLICCEGDSEVVYLTAFVKELSQRSGKSSSGIHIGLKGKRCSKQGLVGACGCQSIKLFQQAESCASSFSYEKVWLIFDLDADGRPDQDEIIKKFIDTIKRADDRTHVAWNIPFFEYWMVLHKKYLTSASPSGIERDVKKAMTSAIERQLPCKKELAISIKKNC